jgi:hypothetical protein
VLAIVLVALGTQFGVPPPSKAQEKQSPLVRQIRAEVLASVETALLRGGQSVSQSAAYRELKRHKALAVCLPWGTTRRGSHVSRSIGRAWGSNHVSLAKQNAMFYCEQGRSRREISDCECEILAEDNVLTLAVPAHFLAVIDVGAVPYIGEAGKADYGKYVRAPAMKAFAIAENGAWGWSSDANKTEIEVKRAALEVCQRNSRDCALYAVNNEIVGKGDDAGLELEFWDAVKGSDDPTQLEAFIKAFPQGTFAGLARLRLKQLTERQIAAAPPPSVSVELMDEMLYALKNANVRQGPSTKTKRLATLKKGTEVTVTGRVKGANWFRIDLDGREAFVYAPLLGEH